MKNLIACAFSLTVFGCASGGDDLDETLLGTWAPDSTSEDFFTFHESGDFVFEENAGTDDHEQVTGSWSVEDTTLTLNGADLEGNHVVMSTTFYASGSTLVIPALLPAHDVVELHGEWSGSFSVRVVEADGALAERMEVDSRYRFFEDGTAELRTDFRDLEENGEERVEGTFTRDETGTIVVTHQSETNSTINLRLQIVDGAALGTPLVKRMDPGAAD